MRISATTTCGWIESSCSTAFVAVLNGKTWCPFSRQIVTMTSTIAGSSSIITIFAIRSAENISNLRKEKGKAEKLGRFAADHEPRDVAGEIDDRFVWIRPLGHRRDCNHVCLISRANFAQGIFHSDRFRWIYRNHSNDFLLWYAGVQASKLAHLCEQAEIRVAGETVRPKTDIDADRVKPLERERTMPKIRVAAWAMCNRRHLRQFCQQIEIRLHDLVQVCDEPPMVGAIDVASAARTRPRAGSRMSFVQLFQKDGERCDRAAVIHWASKGV